VIDGLPALPDIAALRQHSGGYGVINQMRIYEIFDDTKQAFLDRFRDHAARIMATHGFRMQAMWVTEYRGKPAFAYILAWQDEAEMDTAWASFMADQEWKDVKVESAKSGQAMVGEITDLMLDPTDFSAAINVGA
jgi:hypothetical protein